MRDSVYSVVIKVLIASIILGNIVILSYAFLYPRLVFMVKHWGASERAILLSEGPRDNPNMEHLREFYQKMYFIKDNTEEGSELYFVEMGSGLEEAYKILLPRKVCFISLEEFKNVLTTDHKNDRDARYLVFRKENIPELAEKEDIAWNEKGWGICKMR